MRDTGASGWAQYIGVVSSLFVGMLEEERRRWGGGREKGYIASEIGNAWVSMLGPIAASCP